MSKHLKCKVHENVLVTIDMVKLHKIDPNARMYTKAIVHPESFTCKDCGTELVAVFKERTCEHPFHLIKQNHDGAWACGGCGLKMKPIVFQVEEEL